MRLAEGMKILAYGEVGVYEVRGSYQLVVKALLPDGTGDLAAQFEKLKKKLAEEGLFDMQKKRPIPRLPRCIGVVTSPSGAAVRDFLSILRRRRWCGKVVILPSRVQGAEAAGEICAQLREANGMGCFDLVVVMRGGGSLEDLWPFNEEAVARAVASSGVPVISAVGHEIDFTLSDFAADMRAETPSAAAELVSSSFIALRDEIAAAAELSRDILLRRLENAGEQLAASERLFEISSPQSRLRTAAMQLDEAEARLSHTVLEALSQKREMMSAAQSGFKSANPEGGIRLLAEKVGSMAKQLELLSVDSVLERGFAMAVGADGKIIKRARELKSNKNAAGFRLRFYDGDADAYLKM